MVWLICIQPLIAFFALRYYNISLSLFYLVPEQTLNLHSMRNVAVELMPFPERQSNQSSFICKQYDVDYIRGHSKCFLPMVGAINGNRHEFVSNPIHSFCSYGSSLFYPLLIDEEQRWQSVMYSQGNFKRVDNVFNKEITLTQMDSRSISVLL